MEGCFVFLPEWRLCVVSWDLEGDSVQFLRDPSACTCTVDNAVDNCVDKACRLSTDNAIAEPRCRTISTVVLTLLSLSVATPTQRFT